MEQPRHIVMDTSGHLFVSYNSLGTIACIDAATGKQLFSAKTHSQPSTIVLSKNHKFIFVTCYTSDYVDVYKINSDNFRKWHLCPVAVTPLVQMFLKMMINWKHGSAVIVLVRLVFIHLKRSKAKKYRHTDDTVGQ